MFVQAGVDDGDEVLAQFDQRVSTTDLSMSAQQMFAFRPALPASVRLTVRAVGSLAESH